MKRYLSDTSFKISIGFLLATIALLSILAFVLQGELREKLERDSFKQIEVSGNAIIAELVRQTSLIHSLAESLRAVVTSTPYSNKLYHQLLPELLTSNNTNSLVAGGGVWPEPNQLDPEKKRNSYFWGKGDEGTLAFYNDYNLTSGQGYRNEEWYVPARFLNNDSCYWSRSYVDPFSQEPMVTCTIAMRKNDQYIGASTIDMKLEGFARFFKQESEKIGGYVFLVDQNNKIISFPKIDNILKYDKTDLIDTSELVIRTPQFKYLANKLQGLSIKTLTTSPDNKDRQELMAKYFSENSYQVSENQAQIMAATIINPVKHNQTNNSFLLDYFQLENDFILQEKVNVSIFHVPDAYWKLILVTPTSKHLNAVSNIIKKTSKQIIIPTILTMLTFYFFIHFHFIYPLVRFSKHIRKYANNHEDEHPLEGFGSGDFGKLAALYNIKTAMIKKSLLEISESNTQLQIYASYDDLTGSYNRRAFDQFIEELLEKKTRDQYAILYLDLDQFKVVNDTAGHLAGDQLLIEISKSISNSLRDNDILARIGGDEFAMIIHAPTIKVSLDIANRIRKMIADYRFNWENRIFTISGSIGILHLSTMKGNKEKILSCVDSACYAAKEAGRNRHHLYLPEDSGISERFGEMESLVTLRKALDENRLFLEYQLIKHIKGTSPCGFEALVRIKDTEGNTVYPNKFMPAAERFNASWDVDQRVIELAIAEFKVIKKTFSIGFCSINLTADALNHEQLLSTIENAFIKNNISGSNFCFEITETSAIANIDLACNIINSIRKLGSLVSLDDFGTGMSSYGYLKELPIDYLKIDGAFIKNIATDSIDHTFVKSIADIALSMRISTVAEWVENEDITLILKNIGVDYAQGFGISKPMSYSNLILNKKLIEEKINKRY